MEPYIWYIQTFLVDPLQCLFVVSIRKPKNTVINSILTPFRWDTIDIRGIEGVGFSSRLQCFGYYIIFRTDNGNLLNW